MKPIILNMKEMSDSKEVYGSRPNPFFAIFIYGVLAMVVIALIWLYFGKIDIVIKANGIIRPKTQMGTVINAVAGDVIEINYKDGQQVKQGDILYIIDYAREESERSVLAESIKQKEHKLETLGLYKASIEEGKNHVGSFDSEYNVKFESYLINLKAMELDYDSEDKQLSLNYSSLEEGLSKASEELDMMVLLKNSITGGKDLFGSSKEQEAYKNMYQKYIVDIESIHLKYDKQEQDILKDTAQQSADNMSVFYNEAIDGYTLIKKSIEGQKDFFEEGELDLYKAKYDDYVIKIRQLESSYTQLKEFYDVQTALKAIGAVSDNQLEDSKNAMDKAYATVQEYKSSFLLSLDTELNDLKLKLDDLTLKSVNSFSKEDLLRLNTKEKEYYLQKQRLDTIVSVESRITQLETDIEGMENNKEQVKLTKDGQYIVDGEFGNVSVFRINELNSTISQITAVENELMQLNSSLDKLNKQIGASIVKAQLDGKINIANEIAKGDFVLSGTTIMSIIPNRASQLNANIYVSNKDIAKLSGDMKVKYNIHALPNKDYGEIYGNITSISEDLKIDNDNTQGYYLVESDIDDKVYYDSNGNEATLKVGMSFDSQIIVGQKKILFYLLEKIDLWD